MVFFAVCQLLFLYNLIFFFYFLLLLPVLLGSHPNTLSLDKCHKAFSLVFSSTSFRVLGLRFKSLVLFELLLR